MPSRTIRPTQAPEPAPFAYTVAAPDGFTPEAVFVSWDGTGAGGDFLPCVSYYNADGVLLDRAFPSGVTLAAGDTADASYRPFDRSGSAASPGGSVEVTDGITAVPNVATLYTPAPLVVSNPGAGTAEVQVLPAFALGTVTGAPVAVTTSQQLGITTSTSRGVTVAANQWTVAEDGFYRLTAEVGITKTGAAPNTLIIRLDTGALRVPPGFSPQAAPGFAIAAGVNWKAVIVAPRTGFLATGDVITFTVIAFPSGTTFSVDNGWFELERVW